MTERLRRILIPVLGVALSLFVLGEVNYALLGPMAQLAVFTMFGLVLAFLIFPVHERLANIRSLRWLDMALAAAAAFCCAYLIYHGADLGHRVGRYRPMDIAVGVAGILLVLEATRRSIGWALPLFSLLFLAYAYFGRAMPDWLFPHRGYDFERIVAQTFLRTEGVFGTALRVMFTYVYLFVLFGAFLQISGGSQFIIDLAERVFGRRPGGPAKVSVVASGLMGSLSGSAVANAATTGTFTIPMMKSIGFRPHIAGGIEAAASSGGALVPPVMGAGAYMMLEIIRRDPPVTYLEIIQAALIPAVLYYLSIFLIVHFYARRIGARPARAAGQPPRLAIFSFEGATFIGALGALIGLLIYGYSPFRAVTYALGVVLVLSILNPKHPVTALSRAVALAACAAVPVGVWLVSAQWWGRAVSWGEALIFALIAVLLGGLAHPYWRSQVGGAFVRSATAGIPLVVAAACVGIIIGVVTLTGVGTAFPNAIVPLAQQSLFLALLAIMLCSIVLGMGLPSAVSYLLLATLIGPVLGDLGVPILAAHLFIFYFGLMAMVTPPVALAAYATASIAGSKTMLTSITAFRFALVGFTLPFMFVYRPELLLIGPTPEGPALLHIVIAITAAVLGIVSLAAGMAGFLIRPLPPILRAALFVAAACALFPDQRFEVAGWRIAVFDVVGVLILFTVGLLNWRAKSPAPEPPAAVEAPTK